MQLAILVLFLSSLATRFFPEFRLLAVDFVPVFELLASGFVRVCFAVTRFLGLF